MKAHLQNLDKIIEDSCTDLKTIIITNSSIKNNVATFISHICSGQNILAKTIYYIVNVTSTEAEHSYPKHPSYLCHHRCYSLGKVDLWFVLSSLINYNLLQYLKTLENFSIKDLTTQLPFGIAQVVLNRFIIQMSTKRPNSLITSLIFFANRLGNSARKKSMTLSYRTGK